MNRAPKLSGLGAFDHLTVIAVIRKLCTVRRVGSHTRGCGSLPTKAGQVADGRHSLEDRIGQTRDALFALLLRYVLNNRIF